MATMVVIDFIMIVFGFSVERETARGIRLATPSLKKSRQLVKTNVTAFRVCSQSHDAVIRVYDDAGKVIETHEHKGDFKKW